ncbi:MAG: DNA translocase FtsK 4TM domain-containing protein [Anaerolineaceae bacterium]|nr:MAG: DNA translocase FtsK 4TM domain-containing protein [Anaerolineaceae bacterium]
MTKRRTSSTSRRRRASTSRSKKRVRSTRSSGSTSRRKSTGSKRSFSPRWSLSHDRKLDLIGLLLVALGLFTIISLLSTRQTLIGGAWLDLLRMTFGWGMFVIPLVMVAIGLALLLRTFGDRLPKLEVEQILGIGLLYFALLVVMHALTGALDFESGMEQARLGRGGGAIGAAILALTLSALGIGGTVVVLAAWLLIALTFTVGVSIPELVTLVVGAAGWLRDQLPKRKAPVKPLTPISSSPGTAPAVQPAQASVHVDPQGSQTIVSDLTKPAWVLPVMTEVLDPGAEGKADETFDKERARLIEETLRSFGAPARVVEINRGPTITPFGVEPEFIEGRGGRRIKVKVGKISALADDLALALAASRIRVEAPVPGKGYVGIEVPNQEVSLVALRDVMEAESFQRVSSRLRLGLGKDVSGNAVAADLAAMPHLLIAGTTGSGKSVCINAIISSLLLQNTPDELKFVMVDPKRVELTNFNGIPHLLAPVVVELERVVSALQWVMREMNERYQRFAKAGVRNIDDYNQRMVHLEQKPLYTIVVVIDELADLMLLAPDETERVITRLAQLARATGIHLVIATQRPSVDVVTGLIKANFPARVAFAVASSVDSRVILDQPGAERLLGRGDMLFQAPDASLPVRMQGAFVSEAELARLIRYWKNAALSGEETQPRPVTPVEVIPPGAELKQAPLWEEMGELDDELDPIFDEAVGVVREMRRASISLLQRRLRIGYTRAARLVDQLEERGIIGPAQSGSQPREVLDYGELTAPEET